MRNIQIIIDANTIVINKKIKTGDGVAFNKRCVSFALNRSKYLTLSIEVRIFFSRQGYVSFAFDNGAYLLLSIEVRIRIFRWSYKSFAFYRGAYPFQSIEVHIFIYVSVSYLPMDGLIFFRWECFHLSAILSLSPSTGMDLY